MRDRVVADDHTVINTQGIRFVEKIDQNWLNGGKVAYMLRVTYKGDVLNYTYPDAALRDAQYGRLRALLSAPVREPHPMA